jgi:uncharacterized protein (DUF305 family)
MLEREDVPSAGWIVATAVGFAAGVLVAAATLAPHLGRAGAAEDAAHGHAAASSAGDTFQGLMDEAVNRMHADMAVTPSGDPDVDFARMMIPHHQGAVDMALVELRFGHDQRLRRLAQGIIVEQRQEIEVMRAALRDPAPAPTHPASPSR